MDLVSSVKSCAKLYCMFAAGFFETLNAVTGSCCSDLWKNYASGCLRKPYMDSKFWSSSWNPSSSRYDTDWQHISPECITRSPLSSSDWIYGCKPSSNLAAGCLFLMWYSIMLVLLLNWKVESHILPYIWLFCLSGGNGLILSLF